MKQTCANKGGQVVDEFRVFKMLDQLTVTAPGIDAAPALVSLPSGTIHLLPDYTSVQPVTLDLNSPMSMEN